MGDKEHDLLSVAPPSNPDPASSGRSILARAEGMCASGQLKTLEDKDTCISPPEQETRMRKR